MIFCPLFSGSSGNSTFIASKNTRILVDAGLTGKAMEKALCSIHENPNEIDAILITHEHTDHIKGVGILSRRYNIPIYANEATWNAMSKSIGKIKEQNIKTIENDYVEIKDLDITSFRISHDAADPRGYDIQNKNKCACIATDLGFLSNEIKLHLTKADVVLLESNHDVEMLKFGPYPYTLKRRILSKIGHLSNEDCGKAILDISSTKFKKIILGHLSKVNNYPELAYKTVLNVLNDAGLKLNSDLNVTMAERTMPSNYTKF
jgi:phosphoribosyl 1,2-cyclic phosphodiesterase